MWKRIKQIFFKENFNYSTGCVNPLEFHSIVCFLMKSYGVLDKSVFIWSGFLRIFMVCCAVSALAFCALAVFHGCQILDTAVIIEAGTYGIVMSYMLWILSCTKLNIQDFHVLLHILRADFKYACTNGSRYRERFFKNQLQTWKICMFVTFTMAALSVGMVVSAILSLMYYLMTNGPESERQKPLLFPFWTFEVDFNKSPTYELAFIYFDTCIIAYAYNYIFMIVTQILWIREIATKADLVIWGMQDLMENIRLPKNQRESQIFSNIITNRMRIIVQQHQSMYRFMEKFSRVYKKLLMFEQTFCGPVVCLTAYSAVEKLEHGEVNYMLIMLCVSTTIVAFVPSYLCNFLSIKVSSIVLACWDTPFWNATPVIRPYLVLIIQRSLRPLPLRFAGFKEVSLETFANKMTSAYSCFNMLRQAFK